MHVYRATTSQCCGWGGRSDSTNNINESAFNTTMTQCHVGHMLLNGKHIFIPDNSRGLVAEQVAEQVVEQARKEF